MSEEYGNDFISVTDDDGNEFELEHLDTMEFEGEMYMAFVPADMPDTDPDYGIILLKVVEEDGEEILATIDDENELQKVYDAYMEQLFDEENGVDEED